MEVQDLVAGSHISKKDNYLFCFCRRILGISAIWYKSVYYQIWIFGPACAALPATDWSFRFSIQENRKLRYEDSNAMQKFQRCRKVTKFGGASTKEWVKSYFGANIQTWY